MKRKRLSTEAEPERLVEVRTTHIDDMALEDEWAESHYSRPHWARATTETPVKIGDIQEPVVALVDHSSTLLSRIRSSRTFRRFVLLSISLLSR